MGGENVVKLAYQYRLRPTKAQQRALEHLLSLACDLYNAALLQRKLLWKQRRIPFAYKD